MYELDYIISKPLHSIRDTLLDEVKAYLTYQCDIKLTEHKIELTKNAIGCFLLNSYRTFSRGGDRTYLTLDERHYSNSLIVNGRINNRKVSYTYTRQVLKYLYQEDYIDLCIGGVTEYGIDYRNKLGKYKPIKKESSYATNLPKLTMMFHGLNIKEDQYKTNVLHLKGLNKKPKTFKLTEELKSKRDYLHRFNLRSKDFIVTHEDIVYDIQMHKVYNVNINKGGRSFMNGSIQALSPTQREEVLIDGKVTTGYDFVSFEPSLAYSMCQEIMEGDAYSISIAGYDKYTLRELAKHTLMIMLNCKDKSSAKKALNHYIKCNIDVVDLCEKGKIPSEWIHTNKIIELLEGKHQKINSLLYNESSYDLQQVGSLVNDYIVDTLMQQKGVLVLQIHDGFIVQKEYGELLKDTMVKGYGHIFGYTDNCSIKRDF